MHMTQLTAVNLAWGMNGVLDRVDFADVQWRAIKTSSNRMWNSAGL